MKLLGIDQRTGQYAPDEVEFVNGSTVERAQISEVRQGVVILKDGRRIQESDVIRIIQQGVPSSD